MLRDDGSVKDALSVCQLLRARETEGLQVWQAIEIVHMARKSAIDCFDLWMTYEAYACDDLDHAVTKVLEMRALYDNRPERPN